VPERAAEDVKTLELLVNRNALSPRLAACLLMVDFANPLVSPKRAELLKFAPATIGLEPTTNLDTTMVPQILNAATTLNAAAEFKANWDLGPDAWTTTFSARLHEYLQAVATTLATDAGSDAVFRLAESRRREFRGRKMFEFALGLPVAAAVAKNSPPLRMTPTAAVEPQPKAEV